MIISALKEKESSVNYLSKKLGVEQSKLSHALSSLKECNIVLVNKKGKERIYSLNKKTILPMLRLIEKHAQLNCKRECKNCVYN
jgi:DNA-binding transcriptional ArsR family regulator